jgi:magnesium-transporting ATPase (P-type)
MQAGKGAKTDPLSDEARAVSDFKISKNELVELVNKYKTRTYDEEIRVLENLGGVEGMLQKLKSNKETGLNGADFPQRTEAFGNNFRPDPVAKGFCPILLEALDDFMMKVLIVAATASLIFGYIGAAPEDYGHVWIDSVAIYFAVIVVSGVGSLVDWTREREFVKRTIEDNRGNIVRVLRDGELKEMHVNNLHVGDIIELKYGVIIPVDGILIESQQLSCNEAAMTGESDAMRKETLEVCKHRQQEFEE